MAKTNPPKKSPKKAVKKAAKKAARKKTAQKNSAKKAAKKKPVMMSSTTRFDPSKSALRLVKVSGGDYFLHLLNYNDTNTLSSVDDIDIRDNLSITGSGSAYQVNATDSDNNVSGASLNVSPYTFANAKFSTSYGVLSGTDINNIPRSFAIDDIVSINWSGGNVVFGVVALETMTKTGPQKRKKNKS